jgi:hypothetical protein
LTDLSPASQLGLFEGQPGEAQGHIRSARIDSAVDEVRARFGSGALRRGNTIE